MAEFLHVVLTRFNVETEFSHGRTPGQRWLAHRFEQFDRFAYPSMRNQKCQDFKWLVFMDEKTPESFMQRMTGYASWSNLVPYYVDALRLGTFETAELLRQTIATYLQAETTHLITTRFDNDDAVNVGFIANIQNQFSGQAFELINFPDGYLWSKGKLYTKRDLSNPFISLIEDRTDFKTVWCMGHHLLSSAGTIRQLEEGPQWLQVVHGHNVHNRVRDGNLRVPLRRLQADFPINISRRPDDEDSKAIDRENLIKKWKRRTRWRLKKGRRRLLGES